MTCREFHEMFSRMYRENSPDHAFRFARDVWRDYLTGLQFPGKVCMGFVQARLFLELALRNDNLSPQGRKALRDLRLQRPCQYDGLQRDIEIRNASYWHGHKPFGRGCNPYNANVVHLTKGTNAMATKKKVTAKKTTAKKVTAKKTNAVTSKPKAPGRPARFVYDDYSASEIIRAATAEGYSWRQIRDYLDSVGLSEVSDKTINGERWFVTSGRKPVPEMKKRILQEIKKATGKPGSKPEIGNGSQTRTTGKTPSKRKTKETKYATSVEVGAKSPERKPARKKPLKKKPVKK